MSDTENSSGGVLLGEEISFSHSPTPSPATSNKRKRSVTSESTAVKKTKPIKKRKNQVVEDGDLDVQLGLNSAIGRMDSQLLADYVAQRTKRFGGDLSLVELEDRHIPGIQSFTLPSLRSVHFTLSQPLMI